MESLQTTMKSLTDVILDSYRTENPRHPSFEFAKSKPSFRPFPSNLNSNFSLERIRHMHPWNRQTKYSYDFIVRAFEAIMITLMDYSVKFNEGWDLIITTRSLTSEQIQMMEVPKDHAIIVLTCSQVMEITTEKISDMQILNMNLFKICELFVTSLSSEISASTLDLICRRIADFCESTIKSYPEFSCNFCKLGDFSYGISIQKI